MCGEWTAKKLKIRRGKKPKGRNAQGERKGASEQYRLNGANFLDWIDYGRMKSGMGDKRRGKKSLVEARKA